MQHTYEANDDAVGISARDHDICEAAVALPADIARVLYPFLFIKAEKADVRVAFWRKLVLWGDVPQPLLTFLEAKFGDTNWDFVFLHGENKRKSDDEKIKRSYYS